MVKTILAATMGLWIVLVIELVFRDRLPQGALLIPVVSLVICWMRSPSGHLLGGFMLLADWVCRPTTMPLCPMWMPAIASLLVIRGSGPAEDHDRPVRWRIPMPLEIPVLTVCGLLLHIAGLWPLAVPDSPEAVLQHVADRFPPMALVALPLSAVGAMSVRFADEFGLRRLTGG